MDLEALQRHLEEALDEVDCAVDIAKHLQGDLARAGTDNTVGGLQFCITNAKSALDAAERESERVD